MVNADLGLIDKRQALKILRERTGRKFGPGIFSKGFRSGRVRCVGKYVFRRDIDRFLQRRAARASESQAQKNERGLMDARFGIAKIDRRLEALGKKLAVDGRRPLEAARSHLCVALGFLFTASREQGSLDGPALVDRKSEIGNLKSGAE